MDWMPIIDPIAHGMLIMGTAGVNKHRKSDDVEQFENVNGQTVEDRAHVEIHTPGDRWGWLKLGGNWTVILLVITQFIVVMIVWVKFDEHEGHAAARAVAVQKFQDLHDDQLKKELLAAQAEVLAGVTQNKQLLIEMLRESRRQTQLLALTNEQKKLLALEIPPELWELRIQQQRQSDRLRSP